MIPEKIPNKFSHVILVTGSRSWTDVDLIRQALNRAWLQWGPETITRPLLISGHCPTGADGLTERLWSEHDFELLPFPADWLAQGKKAGFVRNQTMVDAAHVFADSGASTVCLAFLDLCQASGCPRRGNERHYSHGATHCLSRAKAAGLPTIKVVATRTCPPATLKEVTA